MNYIRKVERAVSRGVFLNDFIIVRLENYMSFKSQTAQAILYT